MTSPLLAHAAFGIWDELIFGCIAVVFTVMMLYSWFVSRDFEPELTDDEDDLG